MREKLPGEEERVLLRSSEAEIRHLFKGRRYDDPYPPIDVAFLARLSVAPDDDPVGP